MQGLYFNLIGVIKNASNLSESLRKHGSIRVFPDRKKEGQEFALVEFQKRSDDTFGSPATELAEKDMTYFLIQAVNTYKGSTLIIKNAENGKSKEARTDKRGIQRCNIRGNGIVIRVSQRGHVEIYYVDSPTVNNKKKIDCTTLYDNDLPFNNPSILNVKIEANEYLKEHAEDIKEAYKQINKQDGFENKMDLERFRKDEKTETPPVDAKPEIDKDKDKDKGKDVKKPKDEAEKKATTSKKIRSAEIIEEEAEKEIEDSTIEDETSDEKSKDKAEEKTEIELAKDPLTQKLALPVTNTKKPETKKKSKKTKTAKK